MFAINVWTLFRKAFGPWVMAAPARSQSRPSFKPRLEDLENRIVSAQTWWVDTLSDLNSGMTKNSSRRSVGTRLNMVVASISNPERQK